MPLNLPKTLTTFVKVIRSGARDANGDLPPEVWREEGTNPTLNVFDFGDARSVTLVVEELYEPSRRDGIRVYQDTAPTLQSFMGTGGGNVPLTIDQATPIHDQATRFSGKRGDKQDGKGNGLGVGEAGDPMYTLTQGDRHGVMVEPTYGIDNELNAREDLMGTLTAGVNSGSRMQAVFEEPSVRRLSPIECERLQGFPDDWTLERADGKQQADSSRYKQMGNAVAVPVVDWLVSRIASAD